MNLNTVRSSQIWAGRSSRIEQTIFRVVAFGALFFFASCTTTPVAGPHATVLMRDGTTLAGIVTATSPAEITLAGDDNAAHTIPMTKVKSVEYDDAATQTSATQSGSTPSRHARAESDALHEHHYHPTRTEIHTRTFVLPSGTHVSVRTEDTINSATAVEGQTYAAEVADDVLDSSGDVVIPHGANAQIVIRSAAKGGRFHGTSDLVLDLQSVSVEGQQYNISPSSSRKGVKMG